MSPTGRSLLALTMILVLAFAVGCSDRDPSTLEIARANIDPLVFADGFDGDVYPQPFAGTYEEALSVDTEFVQDGSASMKVVVPGAGSTLGGYAGGVLTSVGARDLADFNALTFYVRSNINASLNEVGYGNDNTGNSLFGAGRSAVPVSPAWTFVVIPIPNPSKLISERGLFLFAEGFEPQSSQGHTLWFDEIRFANLGNINNPRPVMSSLSKTYFVGATANLAGTQTTFDIDGADVVVNHQHNYYDFSSSNPAVADVVDGRVEVLGEGDAVITATLAGVPVDGEVTLTGFEAPSGPAPTPTAPAADVVSLYSDAYEDSPVTTWAANWQWSTAEVSDFEIGGETALMYAALNFVGVDFLANTVDISSMTHMHVDVFVPAGTDFKVKIIAFSGDNGGIVDQSELRFAADTTPAMTVGAWSSLEIPMADFGLTADLSHVGQLVFSSADAELVLVDNVYWHR